MAWNQSGYQGRNQGNYGGGQGGRGGNFQTMPNSGVLFPRQKRSQNAADMGGSITLSADLLDYILNAARSGEVKIEVSAWRRSSRDNVNYLSLKAQVPYEIRQQDPAFQQNQTYRPKQNFNPNRRDNGTPDERAQYGPRDSGNGNPDRQDDYNPPLPRSQYAEARGRDGRSTSPPRQSPSDGYDEFKAGDRMPDFMRDDDDNAPPF